MATVLYPGSFDPLHLGHIDVIEQSVALFGKVIVGVMHNPTKPSTMFTLEERTEMIIASISYLPSVKVVGFEGLAVDAVKQVKAAFIVKGLRTGGDFEVEQQMAHTNHAVSGVRTVYLPCKPALVSISSRFIREIAQYGGDVTSLVPAPVASKLAKLFPQNERPHMSYDDGYDDEEYEDDEPGLEDSDAFVRGTNGYVGDAEALLRRAVDVIATAPTMPLSSSPRIDRDEIIELLEEALARLPDEMRQARWMIKERQEFVAKTRREADELLESARVQAERMVQRTEVVRAAEQRARGISEASETDARRLRHETEDFLDQRLGSFEILLDKLTKTVQAGRSRLAIGEHRDVEEVDEDDPTKAFFDQDR